MIHSNIIDFRESLTIQKLGFEFSGCDTAIQNAKRRRTVYQ
jgi:hypothetical protein